MKTVLALIDHPNLDIIIGPVLKKLIERNVNLKVLVINAGKANYMIRNNIPYQTAIDFEKEFFDLLGPKLFLNAADQNFSAHATGRKLDNICRTKRIPSFTLEHGTFFNLHSTSWNYSYRFDADKMAIIGQKDHEGFSRLGVPPERLVITGFPPFDEYFDFIINNAFVIGNYIWVAGQNHSFFSGCSDLVDGLTREKWTALCALHPTCHSPWPAWRRP